MDQPFAASPAHGNAGVPAAFIDVDPRAPEPGEVPEVATAVGYVRTIPGSPWSAASFVCSGTSLGISGDTVAVELDLSSVDVRELAPANSGLLTLELVGPSGRLLDVYVEEAFGGRLLHLGAPDRLAVSLDHLSPTTDIAPPGLPGEGLLIPSTADAGLGAERESVRSICPYCQCENDTATEDCDRCGACHHSDCWIEAGGCAMVGCVESAAAAPNGMPIPPQSGFAAPVPSSPVSQSQYPYPQQHSAPQPVSNSASGLHGTPIGSETPTVTLLSQVPAKRQGRRVLYAACLVALPLLAVVGTKNNWFESITGRMYSEKSLESATESARDTGYSDGRSAGYDSGFEAGKSEGYAEGKKAGYAEGVSAGCESVFDALNTYVVYDSSYNASYYLGKSSCI